MTLTTRAIGIAATSPAGKKRHTIYMNGFTLHFVVPREFESGRAEDRGLVWAAKGTTARRLCEN